MKLVKLPHVEWIPVYLIQTDSDAYQVWIDNHAIMSVSKDVVRAIQDPIISQLTFIGVMATLRDNYAIDQSIARYAASLLKTIKL